MLKRKIFILKSIIVLAFIWSGTILNGQAGAKIYAGPLIAYSYDEIITPNGTVHSGFVAGIDARLNNDRMYFLLGVNYGQLDIIATKSPSFFGDDKMTFVKGRIGLGFDIIRINPRLFITGKFAGTLNYAVDFDTELLKIPNYQTINDGTAGLVGGLGVRMGFVNIDFEYEYGLFNQYNLRKDTRFDFLALTLGINF